MNKNTATTPTTTHHTAIHCTHPGCVSTGLASEFFAPEARSEFWVENGIPRGYLPYPEEVVAAAVCRICWGRRKGFYPLEEVLDFLGRAHRRAVYEERSALRALHDSRRAEEAARRREEADRREAEYATRQAQRRREALVHANGAFGNNPELAAAARASGKTKRRAERLAKQAEAA